MTRNGVIINDDFLDGSGGEGVVWAPVEMMTSLAPGQSFSLAWIGDPAIHKRMGLDTKLIASTNLAKQRSFA